MRYQSYFNTALFVIHQYKGEMPLAHFLKQYFVQHKKYGSRDRKMIAHACYTYFRLGKAMCHVAIETRLKAALYLLLDEPGEWNVIFDSLWGLDWPENRQERWHLLQQKFIELNEADIFPFQDEVSAKLDVTAFIDSFFIQPNVFMRIRPGAEQKIIDQFNSAGIAYEQLGPQTIAVTAGTKIAHLLQNNTVLIVQDYSSQRVGEFMHLIQCNNLPIAVWDCCAASGGKSILAKDVLGNIQLTVSDVRKNILHNLERRFLAAKILNYKAIVADISKPLPPRLAALYFDVIIADVPCTGSGTWSRTPEQLYFFLTQQIENYSRLQQAIVQQAIPQLKPGGYFLYITCSVFKQENEQMVANIVANKGLQLLKQELLTGYNQKADTMFTATGF